MSSFSRKFVLAVLAIVIIASSIGSASAFVYNRQGTVDYAIANGEKNVPGSWYFQLRGGDCTNFVSQSMYIGGWWIQRGPEWTTNQWYYRGAFWGGYSNSWTTVNEFRNFVVNSGRGTEIPFGYNDVWARPERFRVGDIMQVDWTGDGTWDHSMVITKIDGTNVYVTYHSNNRINKKVSELIGGSPGIKLRVLLIKDTYNY